MLGIPQWHPIAVHFPLALTVTGACALTACRVGALRNRRSALATVGTWNLCLGAAGAAAALGTGLAAVLSLKLDAEARAAVALHAKWALCASMALFVLAAWRAASGAADARPSRGFLALVWAVTAALVLTGYRGGLNVYRYGIGVEPARPAATAGAARNPAAHPWANDEKRPRDPSSRIARPRTCVGATRSASRR